MVSSAHSAVVDSASRLLVDVDPARVFYDSDLAPLCTYRVGGRAAVAVEVGSLPDLEAVAAVVAETNCSVLVVGKGSNLLVADEGFDGVVVRLDDSFDFIEISPSGDAETGSSSTGVVCGAATLLPVAARRTAAAALTGFEWAVGVPGSIGGAVRMNAGGHGSDMAASVTSATVFDLRAGEAVEWPPDRLDFGYRRSALERWHVVLFCGLELAPGDPERSAAEISEIVRWRRSNQPGGQNAGSVFANPPGDSAGRLIDSLGLKGFRIGTASVSEKHANFIQAEPGGAAEDVYSLICELRRRVFAAYDVKLRPENILVGFDGRVHAELSADSVGSSEDAR